MNFLFLNSLKMYIVPITEIICRYSTLENLRQYPVTHTICSDPRNLEHGVALTSYGIQTLVIICCQF